MTGRKNNDGDDGEALWALVTQDIVPIHKKAPAPASKRPAAPARTRTVQKAAPTLPVAAPPPPAPPARDIDRRTKQKLGRGQMDIEAVLDLHGQSQQEAFAALQGFIASGQRRGLRCVLVITGKGRGGAGVLRARLSEWLFDPLMNHAVLEVLQAQNKHGGGGAFYVLLRRNRL